MGTWDKFVGPLPAYLDEIPVISSDFASHLRSRARGVARGKGVDMAFRRPQAGVPYLPWLTKLYEMWPNVPVVAIGPGHVYSVGKTKKGANIVIIDHHNVEGYGPLASQYVHLADDIRVKKGDVVKGGTVLGFVGHSGTKFAHLHFALSTSTKDRWGVDPEPLLSQWRVIRVMSSAPRAAVPARHVPPAVKTGKDLGWLIVLLAIAILSSKR